MSRHAAPLHRRLVALLASVPLLVTGALVATAIPAAATPRAFTSVFNQNVNGDILTRGNTLMTCPPGSVLAGGTATCANVQSTASSGTNNNFAMAYVDTDSDSTTFDSSTATVTIPTGAVVLYAGLSWAGSTNAGALDNYPALTGVAAPNAALKNKASFMAPGATGYTTVTATQVDTDGNQYQSYVDETAAVLAAGSGTYAVGNVQAGTGGNSYADWSLTVAYRLSSAPMRNLVVYTGYNTVSSTASSVTIPVSGFTTPATGTVVTRVGVVAYEGDRGATGDSLSVGSTQLSNSLNPANDVFNSTLTDLGTAVTDRNPTYANLLGEDIDRFDASGAIANGATSTTINLTTSGETYYPGLVTFATDLYASAVTATQTVTDAYSGNLNAVGVNDRLNYSVAVTNGGGDNSVATVLKDSVPAGETYVPGSLTVGGVAVTDAAGDDTGDVSGANISARLGTGATALAGGVLAPAASTTVTFAATVNSNDANGQTLSNVATTANTDQTTGIGYAGASNVVTVTLTAPRLTFSTPASTEVSAPFTFSFDESGGTGPLVWSIVAVPPGLTLNSATGVLSGTPTTATGSPFSLNVTVTDANGRTDNKVRSLTVIAGPSLTFAAPASVEVNNAYSTSFTATGGTASYTWSETGALPAGLTLNTGTGVLSGTPTVSGSFPITVQIVDAKGGTATRAATVTVIAGPVPTYPAPASGEINAPYSTTLTASGGTGPYTWATGTLPTGLTLNASTGVISGAPTAATSTTFGVTVTDARSQTATQQTTITIVAGPVTTFAAPPAAVVATAYSDTLTASGGTGPYTWSKTGTLPAGLTLSAAGVLSGTPTAVGSTTFTVTATDTKAQSATTSITFVVASALTLAAPVPPAAVVNAAFSYGLTASGGTGPYRWSSTGTLPAGVTLDAATGVVSGIPTAVGSSTFTVTVTDANGQAASRPLTVVVGKASGVVSVASSAPSVTFGTQVTLTATVGPGSATGSVTFSEVPASGAQSGSTVSLGSGTVSGGVASVTLALPAFGANAVTAAYSGDGSTTPATSVVVPVEVQAYQGELIVREFRLSGAAGPDDSYVELYNTGPAIPLAGFVVKSNDVPGMTLPANAGTLGRYRSFLLTGTGYSLGGVAASDDAVSTSMGAVTAGVKVQAPDSALTQTDAVGPANGATYHLGVHLPSMTSSPTADYAWVRNEVGGRPVDSGSNASDFRLVSTTGAVVGGVQSTVGSPAPIGTASGFQHNAVLPSALLDTAQGAQASPNRVYVAGRPGARGTLTISRTITNTSGSTITAARVRITAISELNGAPEPGVGTQPSPVANLRIVTPATATTVVGSTTVHDLSPDSPATTNGGLNTLLTVPLPNGGLADGASISVAFTFAVDTRGTFWFGYDVDASSTGQTSQAVGRPQLRTQQRPQTVAASGDAGATGRLR